VRAGTSPYYTAMNVLASCIVGAGLVPALSPLIVNVGVWNSGS